LVVVLAVAGPVRAIATPEAMGPVIVPEIVQFVEQFTAVTDRVKACVAFGNNPLLAVIVIGVTDGPAGVPLIVAVPSVLSWKVRGLGSDPEVILKLGVGVPVVVTVKLPFTPTVNVLLMALVICGGVFTVILTVDVTLLPAALVTVNV
jgi:hypothetical protein